jgi:hypothetical protein
LHHSEKIANNQWDRPKGLLRVVVFD